MARVTTVMSEVFHIAEVQKRMSDIAFDNKGVVQLTHRNGSKMKGVLRRTTSGNNGFGSGTFAWYGDVTIVDETNGTEEVIDCLDIQSIP